VGLRGTWQWRRNVLVLVLRVVVDDGRQQQQPWQLTFFQSTRAAIP
jgi:hypothetical protein